MGAKAEDYARRHGVARWYTDAEALIADKEVDAVYIATPPGTHEFYAMKVLAAGKPCYVEKPMARNAAEARRMVEAFRAKGVPLFVAYYRRALPRFLKVKELIGSGVLGQLQYIQYRYSDSQMLAVMERAPWRLQAQDSGGGLVLDMGSHAFDMVDFWVGPLKLDAAQARKAGGLLEVEDQVKTSLTASTGIPVTMGFHFAATESVDEFLVAGDRAKFRMSCFGNEPMQLKHADGTIETFDLPNPPHVAQPLIQTVVDELRGIGKCPSTGEDGLRTQEVMDQALQEYYGGREDGFWNRKWPQAFRD